jgi:hypothetical protein
MFSAGIGYVAAALLAGCGSTYSLNTFEPMAGGPKTAFVDIKQRAIVSGTPPGKDANTNTSGRVVMCAEPSPDALSSLASEFALDAKYKDSLQASLGFSQQEAASFVGLRTQTIQLLRDGMYRLCESYLSGALTEADYSWLMRRYQRNMVALLTIEQLTRVAQAPTVAQASQGMASASRTATAIQGDLEEIDKTRTRLADEKKKISAEKADVDKLPDTDATKTPALADIQTRLDNNQTATTRADEIRTALLEGLKNAKGLLTSGSTTIQVISNQETRPTLSSDVVAAIQKITISVIGQDDLATLCFQVLAGERGVKEKNPGGYTELQTKCAAVLDAGIATFRESSVGGTKVFGEKLDNINLPDFLKNLPEAPPAPTPSPKK